MVRGFLILASVAVLATAAVQTPNGTSLDKLKAYRSWFAVTPQPVDMAPSIAMSCIGPGPLDQAPNPHIPYVFKVFVNPEGKAAMLSDGKKPFPVGSMIVKEKFSLPIEKDRLVRRRPAKTDVPVLLTAMIKREKGFDAANGDWQYVTLPGDASKTNTEGLQHCSTCHLNQKSTDYVFGDYTSIQHGRKRPTRALSPTGEGSGPLTQD